MQTKKPTTPDDMKHPPQELWMDYIYGELPNPQRADLAAHLKSCPACAAQLHLWEEISNVAPMLREEWESPFLWQRIQPALYTADGLLITRENVESHIRR